jgi:hypothetical protein
VARYKGLKGKYWTLLSEYIRRRDFQRYGTCISCGKAVSDWREFDAGHFIPQEAADFLYFLMNVISMESARMITPSTAPISFYRRGLDERYGPGTAHALEERYRDSHFKGKIAKEWRPKEYEAKIIELQEKLAALTPEVAY